MKRKLVLIIIVVIVILSVPTYFLTLSEEDKFMLEYRMNCISAGATWKELPNTGGDFCTYVRDGGGAFSVLTEGCDCGPDMCWNGTGCEPN